MTAEAEPVPTGTPPVGSTPLAPVVPDEPEELSVEPLLVEPS